MIAFSTAIALFNRDPSKIECNPVLAVGSFVVGLICVVLTQKAAFYAMARRSEMHSHLEHEQLNKLITAHFELNDDYRDKLLADGNNQRTSADTKSTNSNWWQYLGIALFVASPAAFIAGCIVSAIALLYAPTISGVPG